jgi:hypothetical protein
MPLSSAVHADRPLTDLSVASIQSDEAFIATKVFPAVPVAKESDTYYVYGTEFFMRDDAKLRGENTQSAGGDYGITEDNYVAKEWSFHKDISKRERRNSDKALRPLEDATRYVSKILGTRRERLWAATFFAAGIWTSNYTGVAGAPGATQFRQWNDQTNATPVTDVEDWKQVILLLTGYEPDTLVVTPDVWKKLKEHPQIIGRLQYNNPGFAASGGKVTMGMVAAMMDLRQLFVAKAVYNTSQIDGTPSNAFVCGTKGALLCYSAPNPGKMEPSAGYHFTWSDEDEVVSSEATRIITEPVPNTNTWMRVDGSIFMAPKVVSADLGLFAASVIA